MNRHSIHQQVDSLLKIIRDQHEQIKNHQASIPQVEIDFMVQNLRQLFEAGLMLNHTNALTSLDEVKAAVTQKILAEKRATDLKQSAPAPVLPEQVVVTANDPGPSLKHPMEEIIAVVGSVEPSVENVPETRKKKKTSFDLNMQFEDKPTLGDKFGNEESIHRKIASSDVSKTLADKLHLKPISDLGSAIGINEKFLFVNQLFDGNLQKFSASVEKINSSDGLSSAKQIAADLAGQLNWDEKNEHVKNFMELVERRFSHSPAHQAEKGV